MRKGSHGRSLLRSVRGKATRRARRAIELAEAEARRLHHSYLGTEHILLGLIDEGEGVAAAALGRMTANLNDVRAAITTIVAPGDNEDAGSEIEATARAERAVRLAEDEAQSMGHHYLGTEHLLLGLIREGEGIAAGVLQSLGIDLDRARQAVIDVLVSMGGSEPAATKGHVITCRVDARDLDAIDALVEAGVRSTRSDAAAWLIHAGIQSHQEILDRVYGTVAEIRRLRDEMSQSLMSDSPPSDGVSSDEHGATH
jgi:ATP-dependent Clp protease ATP-binding subunit ClpA